jgi:guanine deaminase
MLDGLRLTVIASRAASFATKAEPLSFAEAFHLLTCGGAEVLGLAETCGNLAPGKQFDALVVDCGAQPIDLFGGESTLEKFEKFLFLGDDRNIQQVAFARRPNLTQNLSLTVRQVWVDGRCVMRHGEPVPR